MLIPKLHIGTPMYGGMATGTYVESLIRLYNLCAQNGIDVSSTFIYNESLITRARNRVCDAFMKTTDCTHLIWIDADIGFDPDDVIKMLRADKDIIGAACVKKSLVWNRISDAIKKSNGHYLTQDEIMSISGDFVVQWLSDATKEIRLDQPIEVSRLGTGMLMVSRKVMIKMLSANPDRYYLPHGDQATLDGKIHEYFQSRIEPESRQYLSEDYAFCDDAKALGFKVWLAPWIKSSHTGTFKFEGDLNAVARATGTL